MENRDAEEPRRGGAAAAALLAGGLLIIVLWPCAWLAWGALSLMGTLMANDSGQAGAAAHGTLILGMAGGQILAGAAGVPLGLSLFLRGRRRLLLWMFAGLLLAGLLAQALAVYVFFLGLSPS
jgi:hypothetical protein